MKKLLALVLSLVCVLGLVGCSQQTYKLPHDQFCYSMTTSQDIELSTEGKQYIIELLNNATWTNDLAKCANDFVFYTQKEEIHYHSECGTFNDITNQKMTTLSEEQCNTINAMLGIN